MATSKKEFSAVDAAPVVLYALQNTTSPLAVPVLANTSGQLLASTGFQIPAYDYISLSYTGSNLTGVIYKTGGSSGTTVATLTLTYSGSVLSTVTRT